MSVVLIGSRAIKFHSNDFRECLDYDIISPFIEGYIYSQSLSKQIKISRLNRNLYLFRSADIIVENSTIDEYSKESDKLIYDYVINNHSLHNKVLIPNIDLLYAIKLSHRYKKTTVSEFDKTMNDIKFIENKFNLNRNNLSQDLKYILSVRQKEVLSYSHPNLNVNRKEFFTDNVDYIYDHDSIHESIRTLDKPAYSYFKPNENEVMCSKDMFFNLDEEIKIKSVVEEASVLALERSIIPFYPNPTEEILKDRFMYALRKICTSITSGWFREYSYDNFDKIVQNYDPDYYNRFIIGLNNGVIKEFKR